MREWCYKNVKNMFSNHSFSTENNSNYYYLYNSALFIINQLFRRFHLGSSH